MFCAKKMKLFAFLIFVFLVLGAQALPKRKLSQDGKFDDGLQMSPQQHHRVPREIRLLALRDPLDCLSQVVCGLNTYPPQKPTVRTSTANDFSFLLKNAISKLRRQKPTTTTTTTLAPATTKRTTPAPLNDDDEDDEDTIENDLDYERDQDYYNDYSDSGPPPMPIDRRRLKRSSIFKTGREKSSNKNKQNKKKNMEATRRKVSQKPIYFTTPDPALKYANTSPKPIILTPLDRLRMETNLRAKLLSDARCVNGLIDHSCPFNFQQMMSLISSSLEREKTVSFTTNKVLPMVGYLIKSRNYTGTLAATFTAIERIDNYTMEADMMGKPIDFSHILDEILNRNTGDNGLRIVNTANDDSASASIWEDDEFDHVLENPYVRRRPESDNYKLAKKKPEQQQKQKAKQKKKVSNPTENDDQSKTSEEDTSEEGLVFDRPRPPHRGPPGGGENESSSEEDDQNREDEHSQAFDNADRKKKKKFAQDKDKLTPPPVFGHLQNSAEDE